MHFTHRVPTNISCNIQYTQNIHFYFYTSDKLILKNKCSFIFPYNWRILLISTQRTALHFDTADVLELVLQNILFLLIHLIYWYLRIYSLSIDTFNILVFFYVDTYDILVYWQKRSAFLPEHHPEDERGMVQPRR